MKRNSARFLSALLAVLMLSTVFAGGMSFYASGAESKTVSFTSPAIPCDVGKEVDLSGWSVQLTKTGNAKGNLTWSSDAITVNAGKVKATAAGVYPLKATDGSTTKSVYLVAKNPTDTEHVLYSADFSNFNTADIRQLEKTSGAKWGVENGKLYMEAPKDGSVRLAFPEWLGDFGDYKLTAVGTIKSAVNSKRWLSLMARIQSDPGVYYQMCIRQDATLTNGTEFAERYLKSGTSYAWNVTHTAAASEKTSANTEYTYEFVMNGSFASTSVNGKILVQADNATKYTVGDVGLQINQCRGEFSSFKVTLVEEIKIEKPESCYADIVDPESNITLPPVPVTEATSDLAALKASGAVAAVFDVDAALKIKTGGTVESLIKDLEGKLIPIFRVADNAAATALATELAALKHYDAYVMASDVNIVRAAREKNNKLLAILDYSAKSVKPENLGDIREAANIARSRVILLSAEAATRENVEYLQRLFMNVWTVSDSSIVGDAYAITSGANGIITPDPAKLVSRFTDLFKENSVVRTVGVIAHRGVPPLYQENSMAGAIKAYELGATAIENDIHMTKDGVIVVMHDSTVDRTTSATGKISDMTYEEFSKLTLNGSSSLKTEPTPTLEDYFKEFKGKDVQLVVEIKSSDVRIVSKLADLIEQYDIIDQVNIISFTHSQLTALLRILPGISCGALTDDITTSEINPYVSAEKVMGFVQPLGTTYNPSYKTGLAPKVYKALSYRGLTVWPYTLNNQSDFNTHFLAGVNGITTNYTDWMTNVVKTLSAPATLEIDPANGAVEFAPTATTYGRTTSSVNDAEMIFLDGDKELLTFAGGKLSASSESGQATVMFCKTVKLSGSTTFTVYTAPMTVIVGTPVVEDTGSDTQTESDTTTVTEPTEISCAGCAGCSIAAMALAVAALFGCAVVIKKK